MTGEIKIDFQVYDSEDPDILLVMDFSSWSLIENQPAVIEIVPPGSIEAISFNFDKGVINGYNSDNLGTNCSIDESFNSLPDGIYEITLKGSPDTFYKKRYYLKTDRARLELDKQIFSLGLNYSYENDRNKIKSIELIDFLLMAAKSAIKLGEVSVASTHFKEVLRLIEKQKNCLNC